MKILHITSDTYFGGVQEVVLSLCRHVEAEHYVLRLNAGPLETEFGKHARIVRHEAATFEAALPDTLKEIRPDLVHSHNPGGTFPEFMRILVESTIPIVESIHCWNPALEEEERHCAARIVACEALFRLQRSKERLHIIPYPCNIDAAEEGRTRREHYRGKLGVPGDGLIIGRLGNIAVRKRPLDFIRAIPLILAETGPSGLSLRFVLAGSPYENPKLLVKCLEEAQSLAVVSHIEVVCPVEDKFGLLNAFDIFLYPTMLETYCISIAEAMACGLPVVTYRESALPEVVSDAGIVVKVGDIEALAEGVVSLIRSPRDRNALGEQARSIVKSRNRPDAVAGRYLQLYRSVLSS